MILALRATERKLACGFNIDLRLQYSTRELRSRKNDSRQKARIDPPGMPVDLIEEDWAYQIPGSEGGGFLGDERGAEKCQCLSC